MKRTKSTRSVARWLLVSTLICGSAAVVTSCGNMDNALEEIINGGGSGGNSGGGEPLSVKIDLSTVTENLTLVDGDVLTGTLDVANHPVKITIADGATVTLHDVTIEGVHVDDTYKWAGITCLGDATIILEGTNVVRGFHQDYPGIYVPEGKTLNIEGTASDKLTATPWDKGEGFYASYSAGIGGGYELACGNIVIKGGDIMAKAGTRSAGIGGGYNAAMGDITISGGKITATGGEDGAGIGSGREGNKTGAVATITISGADTEVTATGGSSGAGIGTGSGSENVAITINSGKVTATGGNYGAGIGSGNKAKCKDIKINGGTIEANGGIDGAGIGSGCQGKCENITISKGTVNAKGNQKSAGIGTGYATPGESLVSSCGNITILNTVTKVTATKGNNADRCIGNGIDGYDSILCGTVTIGGSTSVNTSSSPYVYQPNP